MICPYCGTPKFRTSRLRFSDIPRLALFHFPVRCRLCRERFHVGMSLAMHLMKTQKLRDMEQASARRAKFKSNDQTQTPV